MDPVIDAPQVETAAPSPAPATAQPESQAGATTFATPERLAEAEREFENYYSDTPPAPADPNGEAMVEPAQNGDTPEGERSPSSEQPLPAASAVEPPPAQAVDDDVVVPGQLRPRLHDQKDIALHILAKANGITVLEAARRMLASEPQQASTIPGVQPGPAAPAAPAEPPASAGIAVQVEALVAEIKADREADRYLTPEHLEKVERLSELRSELRFAKADEARLAREAEARVQAQSQRSAADFNGLWTANAEQVNAANPDLANPKSVLHNVAALVRREMTDARDPRLSTPAGPQAIVDAALARMKDMGLSPTPPAAAATPPVPVPVPPSPAAPAARRVAPAPGSRGQQTGGPLQTVGAAVAATNDPAEIDRMFDEAAENGSLAAGLRRR